MISVTVSGTDGLNYITPFKNSLDPLIVGKGDGTIDGYSVPFEGQMVEKADTADVGDNIGVPFCNSFEGYIVVSEDKGTVEGLSVVNSLERLMVGIIVSGSDGLPVGDIVEGFKVWITVGGNDEVNELSVCKPIEGLKIGAMIRGDEGRAEGFLLCNPTEGLLD